MISAAILNGGRAARFGGRDKGALEAGDRSIRDYQVGVLASLSNDILIVGGDTEPACAVPVRFVPDRHPGQGPLAGLEAALAAARHDLVAVVACDMPGISAALLSDLAARAEGVDVVVPRTESGYHPLCAIYRRTCLPVVSRNVTEGRLAMKGIFEHLRVREVDAVALAALGDPTALLANVNTPADYEALAARLNHER